MRTDFRKSQPTEQIMHMFRKVYILTYTDKDKALYANYKHGVPRPASFQEKVFLRLRQSL